MTSVSRRTDGMPQASNALQATKALSLTEDAKGFFHCVPFLLHRASYCCT